MNKFSLRKSSFWKWMALGTPIPTNEKAVLPPKSNRGHVKLLSSMMDDPTNTLIQRAKAGKAAKSSKAIEKLSRRIPRDYFLNIQYCLSAYSTVFATLFPGMARYLEDLAYIEWMLYMEPDNEHYRDHLVHMFQVAFAVNALLQLEAVRKKAVECQYSSKHFLIWCKTIMDTDPNSWGDERKERVVYTAAYIAAVFHDFGYGYAFLNEYHGHMAGVLPSLAQTADLVGNHGRGSSRLRRSLAAWFVRSYRRNNLGSNARINEDTALNGFFRDHLTLNHSTASAMFLIDQAEQLYKSQSIGDDLYIAFQLAAEAALLHDMTKSGKWLSLSFKPNDRFLGYDDQRKTPLAALLIFADELEIAPRPKITPKAWPKTCTFALDYGKNLVEKISYNEAGGYLVIKANNSECTDFLYKPNSLFLYDLPTKKAALLGIPIKAQTP